MPPKTTPDSPTTPSKTNPSLSTASTSSPNAPNTPRSILKKPGSTKRDSLPLSTPRSALPEGAVSVFTQPTVLKFSRQLTQVREIHKTEEECLTLLLSHFSGKRNKPICDWLTKNYENIPNINLTASLAIGHIKLLLTALYEKSLPSNNLDPLQVQRLTGLAFVCQGSDSEFVFSDNYSNEGIVAYCVGVLPEMNSDFFNYISQVSNNRFRNLLVYCSPEFRAVREIFQKGAVRGTGPSGGDQSDLLESWCDFLIEHNPPLHELDSRVVGLYLKRYLLPQELSLSKQPSFFQPHESCSQTFVIEGLKNITGEVATELNACAVSTITDFFQRFNQLPKSLRHYLNGRLALKKRNHDDHLEFDIFGYVDFVTAYAGLDANLKQGYEQHIHDFGNSIELVDCFVSQTVPDMGVPDRRQGTPKVLTFHSERYRAFSERMKILILPACKKVWGILPAELKKLFLEWYCATAGTAFSADQWATCVYIYPKLTASARQTMQAVSPDELYGFLCFIDVLKTAGPEDIFDEDNILPLLDTMSPDVVSPDAMSSDTLKQFMSFLNKITDPSLMKAFVTIYFNVSELQQTRLQQLSPADLASFLTFYEEGLSTLHPGLRLSLVKFTVGDMLQETFPDLKQERIENSDRCLQSLRRVSTDFGRLEAEEQQKFLRLFGDQSHLVIQVLPEYAQLQGLRREIHHDVAATKMQQMAMASFLCPFSVGMIPSVNYVNAYPLFMAISDFVDRLDADQVYGIKSGDIENLLGVLNHLLSLLKMGDAELYRLSYFAWVVQLKRNLQEQEIHIPEALVLPADRRGSVESSLAYIKTQLPCFRAVLRLLRGSPDSTLPQTMGFGPYAMVAGRESQWMPRISHHGLTSFASPVVHKTPGWFAHYVAMDDEGAQLLIASQGPRQPEHLAPFLDTVGDALVIAVGYFQGESPSGEVYAFLDYRRRLPGNRVINLQVRDNHPVSLLTETGELNDVVLASLRDSAEHLQQNQRILVHCASGVGRTGSFILLLKLFIQIQNSGSNLSCLLAEFCADPENFSEDKQNHLMAIVLRELSILRERRFSLQEPAQLMQIFYELPLLYLCVHKSENCRGINDFRGKAYQLSQQNTSFESAKGYVRLGIEQYSELNPYQAPELVLDSFVQSTEYRNIVLAPQQERYPEAKVAYDEALAKRQMAAMLHRQGLLPESEVEEIHRGLAEKVQPLLHMVVCQLKHNNLAADNSRFSEFRLDPKKYSRRRLLHVSLQDPLRRQIDILGEETVARLTVNFPHGVQIWVNDLGTNPAERERLHQGVIVEHRALIALNSLLCASGMMVRDLEAVFPHTKSAQFLYAEILRAYNEHCKRLGDLQQKDLLPCIKSFQKKIIDLLISVPENSRLRRAALEKELSTKEQLVAGPTVQWFTLAHQNSLAPDFYHAATDAQAMLRQDILVVNKEGDSLTWELVQRKGGEVTAHPPKGMYRGRLANQARTWTGIAEMRGDGLVVEVKDNILRVGSPTQEKGELGVIAAADAINAQVADHREAAGQRPDNCATVTLYNHLITPSGVVGWFGKEIEQFDDARIGAYAASSPVLYMCTRLKKPAAPAFAYRDVLYDREEHNYLVDGVNKLAMIELLRLMQVKISQVPLESTECQAHLGLVRQAAQDYVQVLSNSRSTKADKKAAKRSFEDEETRLYAAVNNFNLDAAFKAFSSSLSGDKKKSTVYKLYAAAHRLFITEDWKKDELNGVLPALLQIFAEELGIFHTLGCKSANDRTAYVMAIKWLLRKELIDQTFQFHDQVLERIRRSCWQEFALTSSDPLTAFDTRGGSPEIPAYVGNAFIPPGTKELITGKKRSSHERYGGAIGFKASVKEWAKTLLPAICIVVGIIVTCAVGVLSLATPLGWVALLLLAVVTFCCVVVEWHNDQVSRMDMGLRKGILARKELPDVPEEGDQPDHGSTLQIGAGVGAEFNPGFELLGPERELGDSSAPAREVSHGNPAAPSAPRSGGGDDAVPDADAPASRGCWPW